MYRHRIMDDLLDELLPDLPAISIDGPKAVGKTATAERRAASVMRMDDRATAQLFDADPDRIGELARPLLIDEWQRVPATWDRVRRHVDRNPGGGQFLLTGSAAPDASLHTGAGRIVSLRMRPLSFAERHQLATVSLREMLDGSARMAGTARVGLTEYVHEVVASGFPAIRELPDRPRGLALSSYLESVVDRDVPEQGYTVRRPQALRAWLAAYAAATASTASWTTIATAATPGERDAAPTRVTSESYRQVLSRLWLLDPVPAWTPSGNHFGRLASAQKHFLADPALAVTLLGLDRQRILAASARPELLGPTDKTLLGRLFEALVALSVQSYAAAADAAVSHYREQSGRREVDFVIRREDGRHVGLEVKLADHVDDDDVKHLRWLRSALGDALQDAAVIYTGEACYRRPDGIAVIPLALLGP
jgi:predicted AAA+ superfamily ATPase